MWLKSDRGVVFITNKWIITKRYCRMFINSLSPARLLIDDSSSLISETETVLYSGIE